MEYNLEQRVECFGENIIIFARTIRPDVITEPLVRQLIRSGTSIGANYFEANQGSSKKDFRNKVCIARKEASETKYWLRMLAKAAPESLKTSQKLWQEANELTMILAKIVSSCDKPIKN